MSVPTRSKELLQRANTIATTALTTLNDPLLAQHNRHQRRNAGARQTTAEAEALKQQLEQHQNRRQHATTIADTIAKLQMERAQHDEAVFDVERRMDALLEEKKDIQQRIDAMRDDMALLETRLPGVELETSQCQSTLAVHTEKQSALTDEIQSHEMTLLQVEESMKLIGLSRTGPVKDRWRQAGAATAKVVPPQEKWLTEGAVVLSPAAAVAADAALQADGAPPMEPGTRRPLSIPSDVTTTQPRGLAFKRVVEHASRTIPSRRAAAQANWTFLCRAIRHGQLQQHYNNNNNNNGSVASLRRLDSMAESVLMSDSSSPTHAMSHLFLNHNNQQGDDVGASSAMDLTAQASMFGKSFAFTVEHHPTFQRLKAQFDRFKENVKREENAAEAARQRYEKQRIELLALRQVVRQYDNNTVDDFVAEIRFYRKERVELYDKLYNGKSHLVPPVQRIYGDVDAKAMSDGSCSPLASSSPRLGRLDALKQEVSQTFHDNARNPESRSYQTRVIDNLKREIKLLRRGAQRLRTMVANYRNKMQGLEADRLFSRDDYLHDGGEAQAQLEALRQQTVVVQERLIGKHNEEKKARERELAQRDGRIERLEGDILEVKRELLMRDSKIEELVLLRDSLTDACRQRDDALLRSKAPFSPDDLSALQALTTLVQASTPELFIQDEVSQAVSKLDGGIVAQRVVQNFLFSMFQPVQAILSALVPHLRDTFRDDIRKTTNSISCLGACGEKLKELLVTSKKSCRKATLMVMEVLQTADGGTRKKGANECFSVACQAGHSVAATIGGGAGGHISREVQVGKSGSAMLTSNVTVQCHIAGISRGTDTIDLAQGEGQSGNGPAVAHALIAQKNTQKRLEKLEKTAAESRKKRDGGVDVERKLAEALYDAQAEVDRLQHMRAGVELARMEVEDAKSGIRGQIEASLEAARVAVKQMIATGQATASSSAPANGSQAKPAPMFVVRVAGLCSDASCQTTAESALLSPGMLTRTATMHRSSGAIRAVSDNLEESLVLPGADVAKDYGSFRSSPKHGKSKAASTSVATPAVAAPPPPTPFAHAKRTTATATQTSPPATKPVMTQCSLITPEMVAATSHGATSSSKASRPPRLQAMDSSTKDEGPQSRSSVKTGTPSVRSTKSETHENDPSLAADKVSKQQSGTIKASSATPLHRLSAAAAVPMAAVPTVPSKTSKDFKALIAAAPSAAPPSSVSSSEEANPTAASASKDGSAPSPATLRTVDDADAASDEAGGSTSSEASPLLDSETSSSVAYPPPLSLGSKVVLATNTPAGRRTSSNAMMSSSAHRSTPKEPAITPSSNRRGSGSVPTSAKDPPLVPPLARPPSATAAAAITTTTTTQPPLLGTEAARGGDISSLARQAAELQQTVELLRTQLTQASGQVSQLQQVSLNEARLAQDVERLRSDRDRWRQLHDQLEEKLSAANIAAKSAPRLELDAVLAACESQVPPGLLASKISSSVGSAEPPRGLASASMPQAAATTRAPSPPRTMYSLSEITHKVREVAAANDALKIALESERRMTYQVKTKLHEAADELASVRAQIDREKGMTRALELQHITEMDSLKHLLKEARQQQTALLSKHEDRLRQAESEKGALDRRIVTLSNVVKDCEADKKGLKQEAELARSRAVAATIQAGHEIERLRSAQHDDNLKLRQELAEERRRACNLLRMVQETRSRLERALTLNEGAKRGGVQQQDGDSENHNVQHSAAVVAVVSGLLQREAAQALSILSLHSRCLELVHTLRSILYLPLRIPDDPVPLIASLKAHYGRCMPHRTAGGDAASEEEGASLDTANLVDDLFRQFYDSAESEDAPVVAPEGTTQTADARHVHIVSIGENVESLVGKLTSLLRGSGTAGGRMNSPGSALSRMRRHRARQAAESASAEEAASSDNELPKVADSDVAHEPVEPRPVGGSSDAKLGAAALNSRTPTWLANGFNQLSQQKAARPLGDLCVVNGISKIGTGGVPCDGGNDDPPPASAATRMDSLPAPSGTFDTSRGGLKSGERNRIGAAAVHDAFAGALAEEGARATLLPPPRKVLPGGGNKSHQQELVRKLQQQQQQLSGLTPRSRSRAFCAVVESSRSLNQHTNGEGGTSPRPPSSPFENTTAVHTIEIAAVLSTLPPRPASTMPADVRQPCDALSEPISVSMAPHEITTGMPRRVGTPLSVQQPRLRAQLHERLTLSEGPAGRQAPVKWASAASFH